MSGESRPVSRVDWSCRRVWVFDMDGTLTVPAHDFAHARQALGIPSHEDILGNLARRTPEDRAAAERWLGVWEEDIARRAEVQADAAALVAHLQAAGCVLGILTRNRVDLAHLTLAAIGLSDAFPAELVLGRACAAPKPAPDGVLQILRTLGASPEDAVMVGDYRYDVEAGRAAGTATLLVDREGDGSPCAAADVIVPHLWPLPVVLPG